MNAVKVGRTIRAIRQMRDISQAQVAEETGLNSNYISRLEGGHRNASLQTIEKIASVLDINYAVLLVFSEMEKPELKEFAPLVFNHLWQRGLNSEKKGEVKIETDNIVYTWSG